MVSENWGLGLFVYKNLTGFYCWWAAGGWGKEASEVLRFGLRMTRMLRMMGVNEILRFAQNDGGFAQNDESSQY